MTGIFAVIALAVLFCIFQMVNHLSVIRRYTLAQFHLKLKISSLEDSDKTELAKKYGLSFDPEKN
jgi:uncharacterized integral membrane protein